MEDLRDHVQAPWGFLMSSRSCPSIGQAVEANQWLGYTAIFTAMFLENLFPPIPSELIMPLVAFMFSRVSWIWCPWPDCWGQCWVPFLGMESVG